ncbi:hypothetical protein AGMMS49944_20910 [Spirochaetia bacterium]|nr:hypothetical protein AGMMS49944_20910 [Spirochaetia bacterium]
MERNTREVVTIKDISGKEMKKSDPITPETTITAKTNAFLYYFGQVGPVVTTVLGLVTTVLSILAVTGVFN